MTLPDEEEKILEVEIERLLPGGVGLTHAEGLTLFVSLAAPGDVLRVECEVMEVRPLRSRPDRGMVILRVRTLNQANEERQDLRAKLVVFRRDSRFGQR